MTLQPEALDREVAVARMRRIEELVAALEQALPRVARSRPDSDAWLAAEQRLGQALRTAARLAAQLVAAGRLGAPESAAGLFEALGKAALLSREDAEALAALAERCDALGDGSAAQDPDALRATLAAAPKRLRGFLRAAARHVGGSAA